MPHVAPSTLAARAAIALTICLLAGAHAPVFAQTCTGSTAINDTTSTPGPIQFGRLTQNGIPSGCAAAKAFPGSADTGNIRSSRIYNFVNNTGATACITVTLSAGSCAGATGLFSAAYAGYNPTDISQNYLGDIGASPSPARSYSFNVPANSEFQVVVYNVNTNQTCSAFTLTVSGTGCPPVSPAIISEFRFGVGSSATGANLDEYIELYNSTDAPLVVATEAGSEGWALVAADGAVRFVVPAGTIIPARGHFLGCNSAGYSLADYPAGDGTKATCDATYTADIPLISGVALFNTTQPTNFTFANRLDAVGYTTNTVPLLYRENGISSFPVSSRGTNYFHVRKLATGLPKDTGDNARDFALVTEGSDSGATLGAPGPENRSSPAQHNALIKASIIDPASPASCADEALACARVRNTTPNPSNFSTFGTLSFRRRFHNSTGAPVTRLRFRVVDITTRVGGTGAPAGAADLRVLTSPDIVVTTAGGTQLTVQGLTREEPPAQLNGGGLNTSLSAGTVTLDDPIPAGETIDVRFLLGVEQTGVFRFYVNVEALHPPVVPTGPTRVRGKSLPRHAVKLSGGGTN